MLRAIAKRHPILWLGALTIVVMILGPYVPFAYDDQGIGTAWFVFSYALTCVFRQSAHVAPLVLHSPAGVLHTFVGVLLGATVYGAADLLLSAWAASGGQSGPPPPSAAETHKPPAARR